MQYLPMDSPPDRAQAPLPVIFWIIWFAILNGLVMIQFIAGGGIPKGEDQGNPPVLYLSIATGLALVALAIRFLLIPRIEEPVRKLPAMIIGLALSEGIGLLGMFLIGKEFPATRLALFVTAIACIASFAPFYAKPKPVNERF